MNVDDVDTRADAVEFFAEQADDLCHFKSHVISVIADLDVPTEQLSDYDNPNDAEFPLEGVVNMFLYKEVRDFGQQETARRLSGAAYVFVRLFVLDAAPDRQ